ncbi:MAG: VOC family protein [Chloroflexi bacterium]|nr:VOC family protein [Chloroflexota bacterium]
MTDSTRLPISRIDQVCVVVRDLQGAMERYWSLLGIGPWRVYTYGAPLVKEMTYRGRPADYRMRIALAQVGPTMFELIQPLQGPTLYHEFLERGGAEGIHHFGVFVPSLDKGIADASAAGFEVVQSGRGFGARGDGGYAYLGTEDALGAIFELIEIPSVRVPPETVYPG